MEDISHPVVPLPVGNVAKNHQNLKDILLPTAITTQKQKQAH